MRDLLLNRAKEGCRLSRTIGEERPEIYRIEAGSDLSLYPYPQKTRELHIFMQLS